MRILQINATYGIGSTGKQTKILHEDLKKFGHESFVAAGVSDGSELNDKNIFIPCGRISKKMSALKARVSGNQNNIASGTTKRILKFIENVKPDVVQIGNVHANFVNLSLLLKYIADKNIPLVVVLHDCWLFTGKCTNYIDAKCYGWQESCGNCPKLRKDIPSWFFDRTRQMLEEKKLLFDNVKKLTVAGVSEAITEDAKKSYVFGGRNCVCIPNVVDDTIFFAEGRQKDDKVTVIAGAAYEWSDYKGASKFARLGEMCKKAYGSAVKIRLAGSYGKLESKTLAALKKSGVELIGSLSQEELAEFYRDSDVFVSLSEGESFGMSISEALSCGLFVIAYDGYAEKEISGQYNN